MYEEVKKTLYDSFLAKNVAIEKLQEPRFANFCCLKTRFYPRKSLTLVVGEFHDTLHETLTLAHEYGHLIQEERMNFKDAEVMHYTILAANYVGMENISDNGKRTILDLERRASELALELLAIMGFTDAQLKQARVTYNTWLLGYTQKAGVEATTMALP